jgi:hypothetical protein
VAETATDTVLYAHKLELELELELEAREWDSAI